MGEERLGLFEGYGVELEYMIVDSKTLAVRPIAERLLEESPGVYVSEMEHGAISWSNELVAHVIELKTNGPAPTLAGLSTKFQANVEDANARLGAVGAMLMPGGMHPWMDPASETVLWAHEYSPVYDRLNGIFNCTGHGWANLQSAHINLPFANDDDFARLHAAIRMVLPIVPALTASSPVIEGRVTGWMDTRLDVYRHNSRRIPSITGHVVPEPVSSESEYNERILQPIYRDLALHDPDGILQHEWINARGAIARFDRGTIEIRVIDVQECPAADLAVAAAIVAVVRMLSASDATSRTSMNRLPTELLSQILQTVSKDGDDAVINDPSYVKLLGSTARNPVTARALWNELLEKPQLSSELSPYKETLHHIVDVGCLAKRICAQLGSDSSRPRLEEVYRELSQCLSEGRLFSATV